MAALKPPWSIGSACGRYRIPVMNGLFRPPPAGDTGSPGPPGLRGLSRFDDTRRAAIRIRVRRVPRREPVHARTDEYERRHDQADEAPIHSRALPSRMLPGCPGKRRAVCLPKMTWYEGGDGLDKVRARPVSSARPAGSRRPGNLPAGRPSSRGSMFPKDDITGHDRVLDAWSRFRGNEGTSDHTIHP